MFPTPRRPMATARFSRPGGRQVQDRGDRPSQHPLRRGRPRASPLQLDAWADRRDCEGSAPAAVAVRRAARVVLHQGRGELCTVTAAHTVAAHPNLRASGPALGAAARACDSVLRLCDSEEPNPAAYNLLRRYLAILDGSESLAGDGEADGAAGLATALAFRLKLALATGFAPELGSCARCGEADELAGFSGAAGGVVCTACEREGFPFSGDAHGFMVEALGRPLAQAPDAAPRALRQAERAITDTLEHHAHVQLRAAA